MGGVFRSVFGGSPRVAAPAPRPAPVAAPVAPVAAPVAVVEEATRLSHVNKKKKGRYSTLLTGGEGLSGGSNENVSGAKTLLGS